MRATGRTALARYAARGKQYLVQLRPIEGGGLVLQQHMYSDEVRPFSEVEVPQGEVKPSISLNPLSYRSPIPNLASR